VIFKIAFRTLATREVAEAYDWCESRKSGLGNDFPEDLEAFLSILEQHPETFSYYDKPVREGRLKRFPYTVVYEVFYRTGNHLQCVHGPAKPLEKKDRLIIGFD
jgi:hypothetical protein